MSFNDALDQDTLSNLELSPQEITDHLDKNIVGQSQAKRMVAIALRNRWRRQKVAEELREEITPKNILMIGPTGVGKTEIARRLAKLFQAPFIKVEASKYTEVGYVGRDVESMIRDLVEVSFNLVRAAKLKTVTKQARKLAIKRIIDKLVPPSPISYQSESENKNDSLADTREKYAQKLKKGELKDTLVELEVPNRPMKNVMEVIPIVGNESMDQFRDMLGRMMPQSSKKKKVPVPDAIEMLTAEESEKLIDFDKVKALAIRRVEELGIVFIDEFDKLAKNSKYGADVSREGVQRDLLPLIEGSVVNTKYGLVKTDHILFIAAGAFHLAKPSDLIPEMQGRFPIRVELGSFKRRRSLPGAKRAAAFAGFSI